MNAVELLCYLTERQVASIFKAARALPADKLDWKPAEGARSALDQLQEVATALDEFKDSWMKRKIEWDDSKFAAWMESRGKLTSIDELEKVCVEQTKTLTDFIRGLNEAEFDQTVEMPFPGEYKLADIVSYHYWNCSYHEGQINYIGNLLAEKA